MFRDNLEQNLALRVILSSIFTRFPIFECIEYVESYDLSRKQPRYCNDDGDLNHTIIYLPVFDSGQRELRFVHNDIIAEKFNIA